ncbi:unnamed protein product [Rotaria socialis]|uniref:Uncharacterized protein n=1 Tax=Rotaria socialis TaxID=392032 RepID=A0A818JF87_9BILA|nr:unnamed protein product [Rotaria socialis]
MLIVLNASGSHGVLISNLRTSLSALCDGPINANGVIHLDTHLTLLSTFISTQNSGSPMLLNARLMTLLAGSLDCHVFILHYGARIVGIIHIKALVV